VSIFHTTLANPQAFTDRFVRVRKDWGHRMGRIYRDMVIRCIEGIEKATDETDSEEQKSEDLMSFYWFVVRELAKCHCK